METKDISDEFIEESVKVIKDHTVDPITEEGALESLLWCVRSQASTFESANKFVFNLRDMSFPGDSSSWRKYTKKEVLLDKQKVHEAAILSGHRFPHQGRFDYSIDYFSRMNGNWWEAIQYGGKEERDALTKEVKYLNQKTISFWHVCLGSHNMLALDVHVMRGLRDLGIKMNPFYIESRVRGTDGQRVRDTPKGKDYDRIEDEAREIFSRDERFLLEDGNVDLGIVDSVLWWRGAKRDSIGQRYLFGKDIYLFMPYADIEI